MYSGVASDKFALPDIYGVVPEEVQSTFNKAESSFGQSLSETLGKHTDSLRSLASNLGIDKISSNLGTTIGDGAKDSLDFVNKTSGKVITGTKDLVSRATNIRNMEMKSYNDVNNIYSEVMGTLGSARNEIQNLKRGTVTTIVNAVRNNEFLNAARSVMLKSDNVERVIKNGDMSSMQGVGRILRQITGVDILDVFDLTSEIALLRGTIIEVASWAAPGLIPKILGTVSDRRVKHYVIQQSAQSIVYSSDIDIIEEFINSVGAATLVSNYPSFPEDLLSRYRFKDGTTPDMYPALLDQVFRVMDALNPSWLKTMRGNNEIFNFSFVTRASSDAHTLLSSDERTRHVVLAASNYPREGLIDLARSMYPRMAVVG